MILTEKVDFEKKNISVTNIAVFQKSFMLLETIICMHFMAFF